VTAPAQSIPPAGLAQLAGSVIMLGCAWPVTKVAVDQGAGPLWFALGRAGFSGLAAAAVLAATGRLRIPGRADLPALLAVGLLQLAAFFALVHAAVALVPAGRTAVLSNTTTVWIVPLSLLVLREPIPPRRWLAAILGLLGVVMLVGPWSIDWHAPGVLLGHLLLLAAAGSFALAIVIVRRAPPRLSMLQLLPWCFGLATLALLPLALAHPPGHWPPGALAAIALIGFVAGPVGTWCVMQASATLPAMVASLGFLATPATGLLLAAVWLHETLDAGLLIGSALILAGVAAAAWPPRRPRPAPAAPPLPTTAGR
jgi:drug/metabolite transporter (DMT)-like permease